MKWTTPREILRQPQSNNTVGTWKCIKNIVHWLLIRNICAHKKGTSHEHSGKIYEFKNFSLHYMKQSNFVCVCVMCVQFICGSAKLNKNTSKSLLNSQKIKIMLRYLVRSEGDGKEIHLLLCSTSHLFRFLTFFIHSFQFLLHTKKYYKTFFFHLYDYTLH